MYPIGCPMFYYSILTRNRHKLYTSQKCKDRYGFIYQRYRPSAYWYELTDMGRKFMLTGLILLYPKSGSVDQMMAASIIAVTYLMLHVQTHAFNKDMEDELTSYSLFSTFITMSLAVLIKAGSGGSDKTFMLMLVNTYMCFYVMYVIFYKLLVVEYSGMFSGLAGGWAACHLSLVSEVARSSMERMAKHGSREEETEGGAQSCSDAYDQWRTD